MTDAASVSDVPVVSTTPEPLPTSIDRAARISELKLDAVVVGVLAVIGALLGLVWESWSPPGPAGVVLPGGIQADETEAFVAGDGRFALLTVIVGVSAGLAVWYLRRVRGPVVALALAVGGIVGALATDLVGWMVRGGSEDGAAGTVVRHLPLSVHMHALWFVEAAAAMLVYSLLVAFAVADDLGRPDPQWEARRDARAEGRSRAGAAAPATPSVGAQGSLQDPRRDGDAASAT